MKITIITVGKNKTVYVEEEATELLKRLQPFAKTELVIAKEVETTKTFPVEKAIEEEGKNILKLIKNYSKEKTKIILCDEKGKEMTSRQFADYMKKSEMDFESIVFVIGGPFGLAPEIKKTGEIISLSQMTMTHQFARIFLMEQIYRAYSILGGKAYHHD